jgi:hypothetical protein
MAASISELVRSGMLLLRGATHDLDKRAAYNSNKSRCAHAGPHRNTSPNAGQVINSIFKKSSEIAGRGELQS